MSSWLPPQQWFASDGYLQSYSNLDSVFHPPPPPHPWSTFRAVSLSVTFMYRSFQPAFDTYKAARPDTTAMLVNRRTGLVYGSTAGGMIPLLVPVGAALRVSQCARSAARCGCPIFRQLPRMLFVPPPPSHSAFVKENLGGEDYFLRREDAKHLGLEML